MSKSLGNVVDPQDIIKQIGTDGLRLWASSIAPGADAVVTKSLLELSAQVYRKIRNTARFLLANISDFDPAQHAVSQDKLLALDYYSLQQLAYLQKSVEQSYADYEITAAFHQLADYCTVSLSSLYLDSIKDRLYTAGADSFERRSAQSACFVILDSLTRLIAPIMSFCAEDISDHYQSGKVESIHLAHFNACSVQMLDPMYLQKIAFIKNLRSQALKALEVLRQENSIRHSLEAALEIYYQSIEHNSLWHSIIQDVEQRGQSIQDFLKELCIVSQCSYKAEPTNKSYSKDFNVHALKAQGSKCPRCWQYSVSDHSDNLCKRCESILNKS